MPDQFPLPFIDATDMPLIEAEMVECATCHERVSPDDTIAHYADDVRTVHCTDCIEVCEGCDTAHLVSEDALEDAHTSEDYSRRHCTDRLCEDCRFSCADCSEDWSNDVSEFTNSADERICPRCADNYHSCDSCGRQVHSDDTHYFSDDDQTYCASCHRQREREREEEEREREEERESAEYVHSYNYRPRPNFHGTDSTIYLGIEVEVDEGGENNDSAVEAAGLHTDSLYYLKHDGSLSDGFEIVSHPATWSHWQTQARLAWCRSLVRSGYRSYQTSTCGMHVHVSRKALSLFHLYKLLSFVKRNREFILRVSRRKAERFDQWAGINQHETTRATIRKAKSGYDVGSRYQAINCEGSSTIEFRIFRGTLSAAAILRNIAFVYSLVQFTKERGAREMTSANYLAWLVTRAPAIIGKPQAKALVAWLVQSQDISDH